MAERLLQDRRIIRDAGRDIRALSDEQEGLIIADRDAGIVLPGIADGKLVGVLQRHRPVKGQRIPADRLRRCSRRFVCLRRLRRGCTGSQHQQERRQQNQIPLFHSAAASVAESKVSVYSISCGVLMAVVSPMTVSAVSNAATGISNVEPFSVDRTS